MRTVKFIILIVLVLVFLNCKNQPADKPAPVKQTETKTSAPTESTLKKEVNFVTMVPEDSLTHRYQKLVLTEAFKRNGIKYNVRAYPSRRALELINIGQADGDAQRNCKFTKDGANPNHFMVYLPTYTLQWIAVSASPDVTVDDWKSLKKNNYKVGYTGGNRLSEKNLKELIHPDNLFATNTRYEGFKMLAAGRYDVFVMANQYIARDMMASDEFGDSGIRISSVLIDIDICPFLKVSNSDLAPMLESTLRDMRNEGLFEQYMEQLQD